MFRFFVLFSLIGSFGFAQEPDDVAMTLTNAKYLNEDPLCNQDSVAKKEEKKNTIVEPQVVIQTKNPIIGYLNIDYLFWAAKRTAVFFELHPIAIENNKIIKGHPAEQKAKWSSGVRAELGFAHIFDWMMDGAFTYYSNQYHRHSHPKPLTKAAILGDQINDYITFSDTTFKLTYWTADFDISTLFNFSSSVTFKPLISARTGYFDYKLNYSAEESRISTLNHDQSFSVQLPTKFLGFGPKIGFNAYYKFERVGLDCFGGLFASLLYGKAKFLDYKFINDAILYNIRGHYKDLKASLELLLGLEWKYYFDEDSKAVMVRIQGDTNYWWDLEDHYHVVETTNSKALILYGFNGGIGLEF